MHTYKSGKCSKDEVTRRLNPASHPQGGYTLLEMLVVLGIVAALTALAAPQVIRYLGEARSDTAAVQIKNIQSALELYYLDTGSYPSSELGLLALVEAPESVSGWRGPYIKRRDGVVDPWARNYIYKHPGDHGAYDVSSFGKDGVAGGDGEDADIVSW